VPPDFFSEIFQALFEVDVKSDLEVVSVAFNLYTVLLFHKDHANENRNIPKIGTRKGDIKESIKMKLFIGKNLFDFTDIIY